MDYSKMMCHCFIKFFAELSSASHSNVLKNSDRNYLFIPSSTATAQRAVKEFAKQLNH